MTEKLYRELLLGCGRARDKRVLAPGTDSTWQALTTLDRNKACQPDYCYDIEMTPLTGLFDDNAFDEIHAYEVLEHVSSQGYVEQFFFLFFEFWQILKPEGFLVATVPSRFSPWLWGDPGHRRAILPETLHFLDRAFYTQCDEKYPSALSDYRDIWKGDFRIIRSDDDKRLHRFVLQAVKPIRTEFVFK